MGTAHKKDRGVDQTYRRCLLYKQPRAAHDFPSPPRRPRRPASQYCPNACLSAHISCCPVLATRLSDAELALRMFCCIKLYCSRSPSRHDPVGLDPVLEWFACSSADEPAKSHIRVAGEPKIGVVMRQYCGGTCILS